MGGDDNKEIDGAYMVMVLAETRWPAFAYCLLPAILPHRPWIVQAVQRDPPLVYPHSPVDTGTPTHWSFLGADKKRKHVICFIGYLTVSP